MARLTRTLVALAILSALAAAQTEFDHMSSAGRDIRKTVIADGIYQFMTMRDAYVRQLNSIVVVCDNDVLLFDTNTRPSSARLILAEIRKITSKPVRYVVNSHHHPDHWSGNQVYAEAFPGLDIIATEQTAQSMHDTVGLWAPRFTAQVKGMQSALEKTAPEDRKQAEDDLHNYQTFVDESLSLIRTYPTLTYADHLTLVHGGREFRFLSVTGDAAGTTVLYLPKEKLLITGDAVSFPVPYVSNQPLRQLASLRMLAALDVDTIIPGHGPAFHDKNFLNMEIDLLDSVEKGVHQAMQKGAQTLDEVHKAVTLDGLREKFAHGDKDLENRFRDRVKFLVKVAIHETGQDY